MVLQHGADEWIANEYGITREAQDAFAARSHQRASAAQNEGRFTREIAPLEIPGKKGQVTRIGSAEVLTAAGGIHSVEARHAAWIRDINGAAPAPRAFDRPKSMKRVLADVASTNFIAPRRRMTRRAQPRFTG